jgi:hypothetical protein
MRVASIAFVFVSFAACSACSGTKATTGTSGSSSSSSGGGAVDSCPIFPADDPWNQEVTGLPVDENSDKYMAAMGASGSSSKTLHPDFGSDPTYGIPYVVVPGSQPKVPITFEYDDESDKGPYPIPANAPIEGGPGADSGDRHVLVIDKDNCRLYETWSTVKKGDAWAAGSGAIFDLKKKNPQRPAGWTSADAAGLSVFAGLVRYDEAVEKGEIKHALRFTVSTTQQGYVTPATHAAGSSADSSLPPLGLRVRLKASYDVSKYTGASKAIAVAMQRYGMILADNGSNWYFSGATDSRWNDDDLGQLKKLPANAFEVVKLAGPVQPER